MDHASGVIGVPARESIAVATVEDSGRATVAGSGDVLAGRGESDSSSTMSPERCRRGQQACAFDVDMSRMRGRSWHSHAAMRPPTRC